MARGRKTIRWVSLVIVLGFALWGLYRLFVHLLEFGPELEIDQFLLPILTLALVVLGLGLVAVLVRNLVRLIVDRKRGILGSRLRTKLVFFLLALVLLPATILFYGSSMIIKETVEAILRAPVEELARQSREVVSEWSGYFQSQSLRRAAAIAEEIDAGDYLRPGRRDDLREMLSRWRQLDARQYLLVTDADGIAAQSGGLSSTPEAGMQGRLEELALALVEQVATSGTPETAIDYLGDGLLARAAVPLAREAPSGGVVLVGIVVPTRLAGNLEGIVVAEREYRQFRVKRRELIRLYLTLIGLIFVATLFIATWIGFYLSRRITVPIEELAAASREISAGNLDVRVRAEVGDEVGTLVEAFNEMATQLQENREVITRSTADLRGSYRQLEERRRYIETLLANLSTAVLSLDLDGRVTTANPAVQEILGVDVPVGGDARQILRRTGLAPLADLLDAAAEAQGDEARRDLSIARPIGTLSVSAQVSPLYGGGGSPLGTLVMVEDLTELLRAQKAAAWREIARRIAHEIKNPLTPIQLAAQRLRKKFREGADDFDRVLPEATASIEREVGALKRLVDEFSRFARMPEVAVREVDFREVVDSVLALYEGLPSIDWEVDVDAQIGRVRMDPEQMRRVFINLIDNAVTAMEQRGKVSIRAQLGAGDHRLHIEFADTGPGIPPEDRDKMFSPYFSTKKRGTGLGLAIVHKVITDHRGEIRVENNAPRGAKFVIEMPS